MRVGTIMEDSPIPLRCWAFAFWMACASTKGVSAKQIPRETGVSYKSALFMMHRIRWAMKPVNDDRGPLTGTVEVDSTYIGGKAHGQGQGYKGNKPVVLSMVQRDGDVRLRRVTDVKEPSVRREVLKHISRSATLMTDEAPVLTNVGRKFFGGRHTVNHSEGEYARGYVTGNTVEGVFALLKRGVKGTFHSVSKEHLHRYLTEFEFRWSTRKLDDGARTMLAIGAANAKRLTHNDLVANW